MADNQGNEMEETERKSRKVLSTDNDQILDPMVKHGLTSLRERSPHSTESFAITMTDRIKSYQSSGTSFETFSQPDVIKWSEKMKELHRAALRTDENECISTREAINHKEQNYEQISSELTSFCTLDANVTPRQRRQRQIIGLGANVFTESKTLFARKVASKDNANLLYFSETILNLEGFNDIVNISTDEYATNLFRPRGGGDLTMLLVIGNEKIVSFKVIDGTYAKTDIIGFLDESWCESTFSSCVKPNETCMIMDEYLLNDMTEIKAWLKEKRIKLILMPPFSPQLSPAHELLALVMNRLKPFRGAVKDIEEMKRRVLDVLRSINNDIVFNMGVLYAHMRENLNFFLLGSDYNE